MGPAHGGFDDEELSISLNQNTNDQRAEASTSRAAQPSTSDAAQASTSASHNDKSKRRSYGGPVPPKAEQRIGQYRIVRTLGEGSFGKVKLAVHNGTNQQVALKIIARKKLISRDMAGRVEREIEYLQLLRHPHIIKL